MLSTVASATLLGVEGHAVTVEVHVSNGLPVFNIVGLPDAACREARDRVRAAVMSSDLTWSLKRVTVNLAPTGIRKGGAGLDLPMAVGLLVADDQLAAAAVEGLAFLGELGLDGAIRRVPGVVPMVDAMAARCVVVPSICVAEAKLVAGDRQVRGVNTLLELVLALRGEGPWPPDPPPVPVVDVPGLDLADVRGHTFGRYALEVAAAGNHHLLMTGPPGSGKTMLASRITGLLPELPARRALEATVVHSAAGASLPGDGLMRHPPFRAPHHSASMVSLVGGGTGMLRPGELSLSHGGVLFLDELGEFAPSVLDALRQPLEEGVVRVSRAKAAVEFPAQILLVAAMNPCPCGGGGGRPGACRCTDAARARYSRRLSGPLVDRFDLRIELIRPGVDELLSLDRGEATGKVRLRVMAAHGLAAARDVEANAFLPAGRLDEVAPLTPGATRLLRRHLETGELSGRGLHRIRRVALTVADLEGGADRVEENHVALALQMRVTPVGLDRWAA